MSEVITYEVLYGILRAEKESNALTKLEKDFFEKVVKYLSEKQAILTSQESKSSVFTASETMKTKHQLDNIQRILKESYERREHKLIDLALFHSRTKELVDTSLMLDTEKQFYDSVLEMLDFFRKNVLYSVLSQNIPKLPSNSSFVSQKSATKGLKTVRFIRAIPKFVGTDMNTYGPFDEEDMALLPETVAELLIKKEKATAL
ncbi:MAG: hypothetical protein AABW49_01100 [Nanoarchaeota archaeon]